MCIYSTIQADNIAHTIYKSINKHTGAGIIRSSRNNHYGKINTLCKFEQFAFGFDSIIILVLAHTITYHKGVEEVDVALLQGGKEVGPLYSLLEVLVHGEGLGPGGRVDQHQDQHEDRTHDRQGWTQRKIYLEIYLNKIYLLKIVF